MEAQRPRQNQNQSADQPHTFQEDNDFERAHDALGPQPHYEERESLMPKEGPVLPQKDPSMGQPSQFKPQPVPMNNQLPPPPLYSNLDIRLEPIKTPRPINMMAPQISSRFPFWAKSNLNACACCYKNEAIIQTTSQAPPLFTFKEVFKEKQYDRKCLEVEIMKTGQLKMDANMVHPFIKMHIIDLNTQKYLGKQIATTAGIANKESAGIVTNGYNKQDIISDFLLPVATQMNDLRVKGQNQAEWNETFVINELSSYLLTKDVLLLFELLDFSPELMMTQKGRKQLNPDNMYPVAWAYLRPCGTAGMHMAQVKLQLFRYRFRYDDAIKYAPLDPLDPRVPPVLLEFNFANKQKYESFLEIKLNFHYKLERPLNVHRYSLRPWEKEIGLHPYEPTDEIFDEIEVADQTVGEKELLKKWEKFVELPSMLPNKKQWKFETDSLGAFKIKFSSFGKYLAASATMENSRTIIKIFDIENGQLKFQLRGHMDIIHELEWSFNDNFLLSASADGSAKVWNLSNKEHQTGDNLNYTENDVTYYCTSMLHPSYVYSARFFPDELYERDSRLVIGTACYDQKVRLWMVTINSRGVALSTECQLVLNIMDKPAHQFVKGTIYEQDHIDDDMLELWVRPNKKATQQVETIKEGGQKLIQTIAASEGFIFDHVHPNTLAFNDTGRLFVGESNGLISVWDISIRQGAIYSDNYHKIRHKELEGDEINLVVVHPEEQNKIFVHSRDNCIRLIEYESFKGPRIRRRFFGSKCKDLMVKSVVSPDGQYLVSGSEDGQPFVWNSYTDEKHKTRKYACKFLDLVADVDWNPKYNMFALSGFGHKFPLLIYVYERSDEELKEVLIRGGVTSAPAPKKVEQQTARNRTSANFTGMGKENDLVGARFGQGKMKVTYDENNNYQYDSELRRPSMNERRPLGSLNY